MFITVFGNHLRLEVKRPLSKKTVASPSSKGLIARLRIKYLKLYTVKEVMEIIRGLDGS